MNSRKSEGAYRTIGEVSETLQVPPHVLRFWEKKFPQIQPLKRSGGRRFYRPEDVSLIGGIRHLLYNQGLTIKGVQKLLDEQGVAHVRDAIEGMSAKPQIQTLGSKQRKQLETVRQNLERLRMLLRDEESSGER